MEREELKKEIIDKIHNIDKPTDLIDILGYVNVYYEDYQKEQEKKRVGI